MIMVSEVYDLINKAVSGNPQENNKLFKICQDPLKKFFSKKIFNRIITDKNTLDAMGDLFRKAFSKTLDAFSNNQNIIRSEDFDLNVFCLSNADEVWRDLIDKWNNDDQKTFNLLFNICRKPLLGFFRGQLFPYITTVEANDLLHDAYIITYQKKQKYPYSLNNKENYRCFYSYLRVISDTKYLAKRSKTVTFLLSGADIPILYRHSREIPESSVRLNYGGKDGRKYQIDQETPNENSTVEDCIIEQEEIRERLLDMKRVLSIKLSTLEFCAFCSKPHQFLAFGFNKWLRWTPAKIAKIYSFTPFALLSQQLIEHTIESIQDRSFSVERDPRESFEPFVRKIEKLTKEVYDKKDYSLIIEHYGKSLIKNLYFSIFYEMNPLNSPKMKPDKWSKKEWDRYKQKISDWSDKVRKSAMNNLGI